MTVQKNLKQLKTDCERILARAEEVSQVRFSGWAESVRG